MVSGLCRGQVPILLLSHPPCNSAFMKATNTRCCPACFLWTLKCVCVCVCAYHVAVFPILMQELTVPPYSTLFR